MTEGSIAYFPARSSGGKRSLVLGTIITLILVLYVSRSGLYRNSSFDNTVPQQNLEQSTEPGLTLSPQATTPGSTPSQLAQSSVSPAQSSQRKCSLIKVSMLYGAQKYQQLEAALDSHRQHCVRWGCRLDTLEHDLTGHRLYSKQYFLLSTMLQELAKPLEERQEWLMWVDADTIIVNPALSPCVFLPSENLEEVYALVAADHNGLNAGVFYLKVHISSVDLLTQVVDYPLVHPEEDLGWFGEQAAMAEVIKSIEARSENATGIVWVPRSWFNLYQTEQGFEGEPGSLLVHFAGLGAPRLGLMADWLDELRHNQESWEIPLKRLPLRKELPTFWSEYAANATRMA